MATSLNDKIKALPRKRRQRVEARASELIGEELSLRDLRKAHELTQTSVAEALGMTQDGVSRIESRSDLLLSTLRSHVEAMGGQLRLVAEFPDRPAVQLAGLATLAGADRSATQRAAAKKPSRREHAR